MKPNFALILSFEGIRLLHRVPSGWHLVGETALDVPDLAVPLGAIREDALRLSPSGVQCKVVIPNDQIRYLTIQTGILPDEVMREQRVALALEGTTPYQVHDLVYNWTVDGENTHIAAVARETLQEAEGFALEYGFTPVSFVAIPEQLAFPGEPFLGIAPSAREALGPTATVARDLQAIRVIGTAKIPRPEPEPDPAPAAENDAAPTAADPEPRPHDPDPIPYKDPEPVPPPGPQPPDADPVPDPPAPDQPDRVPEPTPETEPETPVQPDPQPAPAPPEEPAPDLPEQEPETPAETPDQPDVPPEPPATPDHTPPDVPQPAIDPDLPPAGDPPLEIPSFRAARSGAPDPARQSAPDAGQRGKLPPAPAVGKATEAGPIAFQSIRARRDDATPAAGRLAGATRDAGITDKRLNAPSIPVDPADLPEPPVPLDQTPEPTPTDNSDAAPERLPPAPAPLGNTLKQRPAPEIAGVAARKTGAARSGSTGLAARLAPLTSAASAIFTGRLKPSEKPRQADDDAATSRPEMTAKKVARTAQDPKTTARQRAANERQRLTIFGARRPDSDVVTIGGKPRYLGLILTAILMLFLAGMAAFAAIAPEQLSRLFGFGNDSPAFAEAPPGMDETALAEGDEATPEGHADLAMFDDTDNRPEFGEATGLSAPGLVPPLSPEEVAARYAATGIWQAAPTRPEAPEAITLDDMYQTSIDPSVTIQDAIALPDPRGIAPDAAQRGQRNPMAAGTVTPFDPRGLVQATPEGTLSPEGFTVFAGPPPRKPPQTPTRFAEDPVAETGSADLRLAQIRPRPRPGDLLEQNERTQFGGLTRSELAAIRPRLRPESAQERALAAAQSAARSDAEAARAASLANAVEGAVQEAVTTPEPAVDPRATGTRLAVASSLKPKDRPGNFTRLVQRAREQQETAPAIRTASAAAVKPRTVSPSIPSKANVAKQATVRNAINLRKVNLIGVYGKPSARRALVRLANGRYQKVSVGDRVDGGRVVAISEKELRYQKNGRNVTLKMPKG